MNNNENILNSFISFIEKSAVLNIASTPSADANPDPRVNPVDMSSSGLMHGEKGLVNGPQKAQPIKKIEF
jgi:hypothetical protein